MVRRPDPDILLKNVMQHVRGRHNYGEMLFITRCLQDAIEEDIFHFVIIGTHWFFEVKNDWVCADGRGPHRGLETGLVIYVRHAKAVGSPAGRARFFYSPSYNEHDIIAFSRAINEIREPRKDYPPPAPPVAHPAQPEMKMEPWYFLE